MVYFVESTIKELSVQNAMQHIETEIFTQSTEHILEEYLLKVGKIIVRTKFVLSLIYQNCQNKKAWYQHKCVYSYLFQGFNQHSMPLLSVSFPRPGFFIDFILFEVLRFHLVNRVECQIASCKDNCMPQSEENHIASLDIVHTPFVYQASHCR